MTVQIYRRNVFRPPSGHAHPVRTILKIVAIGDPSKF